MMPESIHFAAFLSLTWLAVLAGCGQSQSVAQTPAVPAAAPAPQASELEIAAEKQSSSEERPASPAAPPSHAAPQSATAEAAKGQRPPADRAPVRPGDAEKITFDDLNLGMQADIVFRDFMADPVRHLEGKRISIVGYMHPPETQRGIKKFILLKNTQCKFGPGGQADHLLDVILHADNSTAFTPSPVKVEGTLKLAPFQGPDGNTWSIYRLEDAQIR